MIDLKDEILSYINGKDYKPMKITELAAKLKLAKNKNKEFTSYIKGMEKEGYLVLSKKGKVMTLESCNLLTGVYSSSERGFGFVIPDIELPEGDIFIPARYSLGAMHNDRVVARIIAKSSDTRRCEGEVVRVTHRNTSTITGSYEKSKGHGFVIPDNRRFCNDIFVSSRDSMKAKTGDKVIVSINKYPQGGRCAEGAVTHVLGESKSREANYLSILYEYGIKPDFPDNVLSQAKSVGDKVSPADMEGRLDLREETIFTIDGADAKDFDDAVSLKKLDNGNFYLGVHIADVSHYVTEGSPLDKEAMRRGTSVYFVDKVVPMLPVTLSNGICSLNPNADRLALSVLMEIDDKGNVLNHKIKKSVIKSCERLTYTDVSAVLNGNDEPLREKYGYLFDTFYLMAELAGILRKKRRNRGSLDFDVPESKVIVNKKGHPIDVVRRERGVSDRIIEEFMLVTNETIAERACNLELPFVFRIHENPDPEKAESFLKTAALLGHPVRIIGNSITPKILQKTLEEIKGTPHERVLSTMMLRSMMKAKYAPQNIGHFGLAAKYYCHFTSPIRRYPDLSIHRILSEMTDGKITEKRKKVLSGFCEVSSVTSSETEQNAVDAEREIEDLYKTIYMHDHIGEVFDGVISSITSFGIFVELESTIEGLVSITSLDDDYYNFDEATMTLIGQHKGKTYKLGDSVRIKVAAADIVSREIDFVFEDEE